MLICFVQEYEALVWDPYLKKEVNALEGVQRRTARLVTNDFKRTNSVTAMLKAMAGEASRTGDKIVHAQVAVPIDNLLVKANSRTQANHKYKFRHIPAT